MTFTFLGGVIVALIFFGILIIRNVIYICPPNKVLVFSGRYRRVESITSDGRRVYKKLGFRIIKGGRGFRWPLFETVDYLDLTNMSVEVKVEDAFAKGAIPLSVHGIANIKISGEEPIIRNAIERFLGKNRNEIMKIAQETLEGNLRGVLATMTPEEVNQDRIKFALQLQKEADEDLGKLGIILDTLKIQNITDKVAYLESLGRIRNADVQRDARIAKAQNWTEATIRNLENKQNKELLKIQVLRKTKEAEFAKRLKDAITKREAVIAEEKAKIAAKVAKAEAEIKLQEARYIQMKHKLEADILKPAIATSNADKEKALGAVAKQIEEGKAKVAALKAIVETWKNSGESAREIFILQKLDSLLPQTLQILQNIKIDKLTYLPKNEGAAGKSARLVEEIKGATGVDLAKIGKRLES